jgi:hypothetical protein
LWVLQGQIALLIEPGTEPPRLTVQLAQLLLSEHWHEHVAVFLALTEEIAVAFGGTLCALCVEHGVTFESCTETALAARLKTELGLIKYHYKM